jgi:predicted lipoprotein with Yx(FWY)xxD motif
MSTTSLRQRLAQVRRGRAASRTLLAGAAGALLFAIAPVGASTSHAAKAVVVSTTSTKKLGTFLVSGLTLYQLNKSDCTSAQCLKAWPPLLLPKGATKATAGPGVNAAKLATTKAPNGGLQVTYAGKALFWFFKDKAPGQVNGNKVKDQWGRWTVVTTVKPKSSGATTTIHPVGGTTTTTHPVVITTTTHPVGATTTTTHPITGGGTTTTTHPVVTTTTTTSPSSGGVSF